MKHKVIRQVFYKEDSPSLFAEYSDLRMAIKQHNEMLEKQHEKRLGHPLNEAAADGASEEQKTEALMARYAFRHWKDCFF